MRRRRSLLARLYVVIIAAALIAAPSRRASADPLLDLSLDFLNEAAPTFLLGLFVVGVVGTDIGFIIRDAACASSDPPDGRGMYIAESILMTPQALIGDVAVALAGVHVDERDGEPILLVTMLPSVLLNTMAVHGIWGASAPKTDPGLLYGGSWAIGVNTAFTIASVSAGIAGKMPTLPYGVAELTAMTPSLAVGIYGLAASGAPHRSELVGLVSWSGALFLHGAAALGFGIHELTHPKAKEPDEAKASREGILPRLRLAPTVIGGGPVPARGLTVYGTF